jgi:hypothetical protein
MAPIKKIYEWLFYLIENTLTADESDKIAKVKTRKTKTIDDLASRIVAERTEYRKETIVNIITLANAVKLDFLSQGEMVNDGLVLFEPAITGNFYETTDFDEARNTCIVNTRVSNEVHAMLKQVRGVYSGLTVENGGAVITGVTDATTGATTGEVTAGKVITITGKKIRIVPPDGDTIENCISYTHLATGSVVTQQDPVVTNDPSRIVLQLPRLMSGLHTLTLKTLFSTTIVQLKAPRYMTSKLKLEVK